MKKQDIKKGTDYIFLGIVNKDSTTTCYKPGDIVTVTGTPDNNFIRVKDTNRGVEQVCDINQIKPIPQEDMLDLEIMFKVGNYIQCVDILDNSTKLAKIVGRSVTPPTASKFYAYITFITRDGLFNKNQYQCIHSARMISEPLTKTNAEWLEYCIRVDNFVTFDEFKKATTPSVEHKISFPNDGWCEDADKNLGHFLAERFDMSFSTPGKRGYAWNSTSYWTIDVASGKSTYELSYLNNIIRDIKESTKQEPKTFSSSSLEQKQPFLPKFKKEEYVTICKTDKDKPGTHRFDVGTTVKIIEINIRGRFPYRCIANSEIWWVGEEDLKYNEVNVGITPGNYNSSIMATTGSPVRGPGYNGPIIMGSTGGGLSALIPPADIPYPHLIDEIGHWEKRRPNQYIMGVDPWEKVDTNSSFMWVQDPLRIDPNIKPFWLTESEASSSTDNVWTKLRKMLHLTNSPDEIEIKDRTVKPINVSSKIKDIDKGLIVPLEPIKNRVHK